MAKTKKTDVETTDTDASGSAVNKTQAVKEYLRKHRQALPTTVSETLRSQGIDVSPKYVSNIKFQMGIRRKGKKATKPAAESAAAATTASPADDDQISLSSLLEAKKLIEKLGSAEAAKRAILALAQLNK